MLYNTLKADSLDMESVKYQPVEEIDTKPGALLMKAPEQTPRMQQSSQVAVTPLIRQRASNANMEIWITLDMQKCIAD